MIHITFDPAQLSPELQQEWQAWQQRADEATQRAITAWEEWRNQGAQEAFTYTFPKKDEQVWGELKDWLLRNVFHNKCAYCEVREVRSPYHAEHWRPKSRVRFKVAGQKKAQPAMTMDIDGNQIEHPGYFWLAFHWLNLLPACHACNSALGKNDLFPTSSAYTAVRRLSAAEMAQLRETRIKSNRWGDIYFLQPGDLDVLEQPLLLHPYFDDPQEHLGFDESGIPFARNESAKGKYSIQIFNLDAQKLCDARSIAQEAAFKDYMDALKQSKRRTRAEKLADGRAALEDYYRAEAPFSAAVLDYLRMIFPDHGL